MSRPQVPGVPGMRLPPADEETRLRREAQRKRESLHAHRKNSPPDGTPATTQEEGRLLADLADAEEQLQRYKARQKRELMRPPAELEVVQAPAPDPTAKPPANLAWLTYIIPPIVTGVAGILSANYIKKDDFDAALKAQIEATATLTKQVETERSERLKLEQCIKVHLAQGKTFQIVTIAGLNKLGIDISGQKKETDEVDWISKQMGDPNTGKLPKWAPKDVNGNEIQVPVVVCEQPQRLTP